MLLLLSAFQAMACPEVGTQVEQAYELFNDAEAEEASAKSAKATAAADSVKAEV